MAGIEACSTLYPETLQVAVFDTAFHSTLPRRANTMPLIKRQRKSMVYVDLVSMDCLIVGLPIR